MKQIPPLCFIFSTVKGWIWHLRTIGQKGIWSILYNAKMSNSDRAAACLKKQLDHAQSLWTTLGDQIPSASCSKDDRHWLFDSERRKRLFNSSTPTAQAEKLHFISSDISLYQIPKMQNFATEPLADRQAQGKQHICLAPQMSCTSWQA